MDMGTSHNIAGSGRRLVFSAEFKQASWINHEAYFRIVVPGMYVPSFLPLSLQILSKRSSDKVLKEPFHLTNIRVELVEFSCVPSKYTEATDIRSMVLIEKETSMEINSLNSKILIPSAMYGCTIPQIGPTFFIGGFTRTYGLKVTLSICSKRDARFNVSAFIELHVAQARHERIDAKDVDKLLLHFVGCNEDEDTRGQHLFMKSLQDFETNKKCVCPSWETRVLDLPTFGTGTGFDKPHSATCIVVDGHVIEANSPQPFLRAKTLFPYPSYPIGEEKIPLSIRVSLDENTQFYNSREGSYIGIASPGMELNKFIQCTFIVAQGFKEASQFRQVDDVEICLEQIYITLKELKLEKGQISSKRVTLLDDRKSRFLIRWSEFQDAVAGSERARAMTNEGRNTNENDLAINNPQPYDEEIYLFILQSDDPVWDYLYCRIRRLEEKRGNMTAMEVSELHFLRNMDADLRWGRFLGGEIPGRIFLRSQFYRDILDPRISALISRSWSEDEVLQHDDPVKFYLIWRSKKQLREERWAEHWDLDPNAIVQIPELDEIIRNLPVLETSRSLKKNTKAYQCCNQLLTNLRESDEVLYEPEIRYLKKLLGKFEPSRLWSLIPPIALAGNAICFFVSIAENKPVAEGHFC
ncbi:hypothetical protein C7M61_002239 [Candidozyma pseudohaemuli]|uniref:Uncharacterized protein n=1 Tax=Candidozyma pseudohaemuli TaxID=418784 RepID=A0A2P7YSI6_9ASCO|nr:hypothetical protein C7M61_002239 [[Candida] pseudohaemulonii]PSK38933.1 hypothetical protein C7M61_002239 [[Candida] pseudohaemulonii]